MHAYTHSWIVWLQKYFLNVYFFKFRIYRTNLLLVKSKYSLSIWCHEWTNQWENLGLLVTKSILLPVRLVNITLLKKKMNVGIVLLDFPLIYKMFCKSLCKCEDKAENENKLFTTFLVSATRNLFPRLEILRT